MDIQALVLILEDRVSFLEQQLIYYAELYEKVRMDMDRLIKVNAVIDRIYKSEQGLTFDQVVTIAREKVEKEEGGKDE